MEEDTPVFQIPRVDKDSGWPERARKPLVKPAGLPPSHDQNFWIDNEGTEIMNKDEINARASQMAASMQNHQVKQIGREFICQSCPVIHTLPLDPDKFTVKDGFIVPVT